MSTRKELKEEYKQKKYQMGVYQIRNLLNAKVYIGSSLDLQAAWHSQQFQLNSGLHQNSDLQKEWTEFGEKAFVYDILEVYKQPEDKVVDLKKELKAFEEMVIDEIQPFDAKGYNRRRKI